VGPRWNPLNQRRADELSPAVGSGANRVATDASLSGPSRLCLREACIVHLVGEMNCRFVSSRIEGLLRTPRLSPGLSPELGSEALVLRGTCLLVASG
jgi:hypothetical protein